MHSSKNTCPLSIDNTVAPGTELLCWDTSEYNQLRIGITGIDAAEYEVVGFAGPDVLIASITLDDTYEIDVTKYTRVCLRMVVSGVGTANVDAYLVDITGDVVSFVDLCVPFFLADGTASNIPLIGLQLPFFLADGTPSPISVVPC